MEGRGIKAEYMPILYFKLRMQYSREVLIHPSSAKYWGTNVIFCVIHRSHIFYDDVYVICIIL